MALALVAGTGCDGDTTSAQEGVGGSRTRGYDYEPAYVGFAAPVSDLEGERLLSQYGARVFAVHTWLEGFSGTHRVALAAAPRDLFRAARDEAVASFSESLNANAVRLRRFAAAHSDAQVMADESLQTELRDLLLFRTRFQKAIDSAKRGDALVWSAHITASGDRLDQLAREQPRAVVNRMQSWTGTLKASRPKKPNMLEAYDRDLGGAFHAPEQLRANLVSWRSSAPLGEKR